MKLKHTLLAAVLGLGFTAAHADLVEGTDYTVLKDPLPQLQSGKIEVAEFFGYFCVHCYHLEPVLQKHSKKWSSDTYIRPIHVVWQPEMEGMARVAAAINKSGMKYQANLPVFKAVYEQKIDLGDDETFKKWAPAQSSFDSAKLLAAYDTAENRQEAKQMAELTDKMGINGTPTFIIGGKYRVIFTSGDWEQSMKKVEDIIDKVRKERGMKTAAAQAPVRSKGAMLAKAANQ